MKVIRKGHRVGCFEFQGIRKRHFLLLFALMTGCGTTGWGDDLYMGGSLSAVPNIGLSLTAGQIFERDEKRAWSFELEMTHQPWDDEDFAGDGNPAAGDITQFHMGVKRSSDPLGHRHWTQRYGFGWFRARGIPNIVQEPGDYAGLYAGFGFETQLTESISMGPELSLMPATMEGGHSDVFWVPQFNWHITWGF
jgi:hypothetical protein